jgi:hypothetical protein
LKKKLEERIASVTKPPKVDSEPKKQEDQTQNDNSENVPQESSTPYDQNRKENEEPGEDWEASEDVVHSYTDYDSLIANETQNSDAMQLDDEKEEEKPKDIEITIKKDDLKEEAEEEPKEKRKRTQVKRKTKEERSIEVYTHQTLLLTFLACHLRRCQLSDSELVQAVMFSMVPKRLHFNEVIEIDDDDDEDDEDLESTPKKKAPQKRMDSLNIKNILKWFDEMFQITPEEIEEEEEEKTPKKRMKKNSKKVAKKSAKKKTEEQKPDIKMDIPFAITEESLLESIHKGTLNELENVIACTATLKSLGYLCRMVTVIDPEQYQRQSPVKVEKKKKISPFKKASASDSSETESTLQHNDLWIEIYAVNEQRWIQIRYQNGSMSSGMVNATTSFFEGFMFKTSPTSKEEKKTEENEEDELSVDKIVRRLCVLPTFVIGVTTHRHQCIIQDITALHYVNKIAQSTLIASQQYEDVDLWFHNRVIDRINARIRRRSRSIRNKDLALITQIVSSENERILRIQQLMSRELPTTQEAYKSHPLYCIEKYINKYEAFYPEDPPSVGKVGKFDVYERRYLHELHACDRWIKEGRQVVTDEKPYKIVKASHMSSKENTELFGKWQTIAYMAPVAANGQVPKNERGQVDLWHERMLPVGTVHLRITGIGKVAKKLNIDYAPAMTGFEIRGKRSVPVIDGVVVCEEFEDILRDACVESERIRLAKVQERVETRVYKHWRRLILRLMARKEVNEMYKVSL